MAKFYQKFEARKLRSNGMSVKSIASELKVSSSSVSLWVRDIVLTEEQYKQLENNKNDPYYGRRLTYINQIKERTNKKIENLKSDGIREIGILNKRELFLVGNALYWSEGFKKDTQVGFANSDPFMVRLFIKWLTECFEYKMEDLIPIVTVNESHEDRIKEIENHWSEATKIPIDQFRKPFYQKVVWKKTYEKPNEYYGLLRIKVRKSKDFLRKIHGYIEGLRLQASI